MDATHALGQVRARIPLPIGRRVCLAVDAELLITCSPCTSPDFDSIEVEAGVGPRETVKGKSRGCNIAKGKRGAGHEGDTACGCHRHTLGMSRPSCTCLEPAPPAPGIRTVFCQVHASPDESAASSCHESCGLLVELRPGSCDGVRVHVGHDPTELLAEVMRVFDPDG